MFEFLKSKNKVVNNIETKSVQNQLTGSVSSIYSDFNSSVRMPSDSVSILSYNKGYAAVCSRIISQAIADLPYYLYRVSNAKNGKYLGKSQKVKDSCQLNKINKAIKTGDYTLDKIFEHPFLTLLEESMERSITEFFYLMSMYYLTIGNCYVLVEKDIRGNLINLKILMSEYVSVRYDKDFNIAAYVYQPLLSGGQTVTYLPEQIIHIKRTTAGSMIVGRGVLEDCLMSVSLSEETKKYLNCLLNNSMTPKDLIVVKNNVKTEDEAIRIKDKFVENFGGYNRGKAAVVFGEVEVQNLAQNMKDNAMLETNEYAKREICAIFGVPIDLVDSSNSNRATSLVAMNNFKQNTVFPIANNMCDQLTKSLIHKLYDKSFLVQYDSTEAMENDPIEQAQLFKSYLEMGIMTVEEIKQKLGII